VENPSEGGNGEATVVRDEIRQHLQQAILEAEVPTYIYSYPPKRAYRPLAPPEDLRAAWSEGNREINLYLHIPFCHYRCTFCTLFLTTAHTPEMIDAYVDALDRQIRRFGELAGERTVASIYVGGGTPTVLSPRQFDRVFGGIRGSFPRVSGTAEISVEGTPDSMTPEILACLRSLGVNRISMGIQTFDPVEMERAGRRYGAQVAVQAIENVRAAGFDNLNLDLIYGLEGQQSGSWTNTLSRTLSFEPTTVTLYPAVFRPLSGIHKLRSRNPGAFLDEPSRADLYDLSVETLERLGYRQESLVRFTRHSQGGYRQEESDSLGVPLLGCGAGARSYCGRVHYSTDFAMARRTTLEIIEGFIASQQEPSYEAGFGFVLDRDEEERRFVILNLLLDRLSPAAFARRFGSNPQDRFAEEFAALAAEECIGVEADGQVRLTRKGFKHSSIVGNLFYSQSVRDLEEAYRPQ
jgi:oxygen-independent coproporphyrinogen-3 oxidase